MPTRAILLFVMVACRCNPIPVLARAISPPWSGDDSGAALSAPVLPVAAEGLNVPALSAVRSSKFVSIKRGLRVTIVPPDFVFTAALPSLRSRSTAFSRSFSARRISPRLMPKLALLMLDRVDAGRPGASCGAFDALLSFLLKPLFGDRVDDGRPAASFGGTGLPGI